MFKYTMHSVDGDMLGDAAYAERIHAGELIHFGVARFEVVRLIDLSDDDASPFDGLLQIEPVE